MSKELAFNENANIAWDLHEKNEIIPLEFTEENNVDLFGIEPVKAKEMVSGLSTTLAERQVLKDAYVDVIELEITTENLPTFKELRLKIMKNRTQGLTKWKEKEKSFYLAGGNFIQAIYNKEVAINEEMESKLLEAEKFFENQEKEKARLAKIKADKAPVKEQLTIWVNSFELPEYNVKNELQAEIVAKFEAFKKWSKTQIDNL